MRRKKSFAKCAKNDQRKFIIVELIFVDIVCKANSKLFSPSACGIFANGLWVKRVGETRLSRVENMIAFAHSFYPALGQVPGSKMNGVTIDH